MSRFIYKPDLKNMGTPGFVLIIAACCSLLLIHFVPFVQQTSDQFRWFLWYLLKHSQCFHLLGRPTNDTLEYVSTMRLRNYKRSIPGGSSDPSTASTPCLASSTSSHSPSSPVLSLSPVSIHSCSASILHPASDLL